jgi:hypothetical protein
MRRREKVTDYLKSFLQKADIGQSRSAITNQLQWAMVILGACTMLFWLARLPIWLVYTTGVSLFAVIALFMFVYLYFMFHNPDALRSEHFNLSKLAIEKGLIGDSLHGVSDSQPLNTAMMNTEEQKLISSGDKSLNG